jgi:NADPH-dependent curcumin reductase CurA
MRKFDVPIFAMPHSNRQVILVRRPRGVPDADDFSIVESAIPEPRPGEFLVRNVYLSVDPAQRGWAADTANYSAPIALNTTMRALAVGVVVRSRLKAVPEGAHLYGWFGWQDYFCGDAGAILRYVDPKRAPLSAYAGVLGINGLTAYLAFTGLGGAQAGQTVLISTAAGSVGSLVGQIASLSGCVAVGLTGSDEKVELCLKRFGYATAFNYHTSDIAAVIAEACPKGIDIYFDNTGGTILDIALRNMALRGRIIQCGTASISSWNPPPTGVRNEREVLTRRLRWEGFVVFDHVDRFEEAGERLLEWLDQSVLNYAEEISLGIETAPGSLAGLYVGDNLGKKLIFIG